jgi:L-fuconolactonase
MIVDTHTHLYDPTRPQGIPWPPKDNELLYRTVLPKHFSEVANPCGVTHTVVVEASVWVEDNDWILDLAKDEPAIVGFVGNLDPQQDDYFANLDRLSENELFRGLRLRRKELERTDDPNTLSAIKALADRDLEMDLLAQPGDLAAVASVAKAIPDLRIVCNHVAHVVIDGNNPDPEWIAGLNAIAPYPNVYMKVSGFVERAATQPAPSDPEYYKPTFDAMWDALGEDRLVYGSNWPVCERAAPYATVFAIADAFFSDKGETAREKYFVENGRGAYKWVER